MSREYDNTNRGVLFKNEDKQRETHADYRGNINVGGVEYWLDAWVKEAKQSGKKFFSLSIKPKMAPGDRPPTGGRNDQRSGRPPIADVGEFDDDIPF